MQTNKLITYSSQIQKIVWNLLSSVIISLTSWVEPRANVRTERLSQWNISMTRSGIEPASSSVPQSNTPTRIPWQSGSNWRCQQYVSSKRHNSTFQKTATFIRNTFSTCYYSRLLPKAECWPGYGKTKSELT